MGHSAEIIDEPFVGLRSMREEEADLFFGRTAEIAELVENFGRHRIVAIVADSGTGKSSLADKDAAFQRHLQERDYLLVHAAHYLFTVRSPRRG